MILRLTDSIGTGVGRYGFAARAIDVTASPTGSRGSHPTGEAGASNLSIIFKVALAIAVTYFLLVSALVICG